MNIERVVSELQQLFPKGAIVCIPEKDPKEIICEADPAYLHPNYSTAIIYLDKSEPHYHEKSTETYTVLCGTLVLFACGKKHTLQEGGRYTVPAGEVHWAEGNETMVRVDSSPGWTKEDHILV